MQNTPQEGAEEPQEPLRVPIGTGDAPLAATRLVAAESPEAVDHWDFRIWRQA